MKRTVCVMVLTVILVLTAGTGIFAAGAQEKTNESMVIAHLPKSVGGAWYTRMFEGFKMYNQKHSDVSVIQIGASEGDAALQIKAIEDFITDTQGKEAALCISFVSPEAMEQILKKAQDCGIIVIGNEGPGVKNVSYDLEAFDNPTFGAAMCDELAGNMGGEGEYVVFVGKLSSSTHVQWADSLVKQAKAKYPKMKLVEPVYIEGGYNQQNSYEKAKEIIKTYPNIKGFFCTSATDTPGVARAIDESSKKNQMSFVALGTPNLSREFVKSGSIKLLSGWDPAEMALAMCRLIEIIKEGGSVKSGDDLNVFGYDSIIVDGKLVKGNAWKMITKENVDEFDY